MIVTLADTRPVRVVAEIIQRHANWARLRPLAPHETEPAIRWDDGAEALDRELLATGPLGVPLALRLPRHIAEVNRLPFEEIEP